MRMQTITLLPISLLKVKRFFLYLIFGLIKLLFVQYKLHRYARNLNPSVENYDDSVPERREKFSRCEG